MTKIFGKHFYFDRSSRRDGGAAPGAGVLPGPVNANTPIRHPQDSGPRPFTLNLGIAEFAFSSGKLAKANPAATPETPVTSFPKTEVTETHVLSIDVDAIGDNNKKYGEASTSDSAPKVITVPSIKTNVLHTDQKPLSNKKIQDFLRQHSHPPIAKTNVLHTDQKPLSKKKIQDFLRQHSNPSIAKTVTPIAPIKWKTVTMRPSPLKPLIAAVNANNEEQIKALATALHEKNNYTAKDIAPILTRAIQNGASLEVKKALADLAKLDPTHLFDAAAKADDVELVRHLAQKATPPAEALGSGSPKMQRLLKVISDAHALYPSPTDPMTVQKLIHAAAKADDLELIRELVREGKPPAGALRCGGRKMQQFLAEIDDAYTPFSSPTHQLTKQKLERNIKRFDTNEAAYERYLNENTVAHMTERLRQVAAAAKKPEARINLMNELGSALVKAPAAIQSQVVGNLIQALGVAGAGDQKNTHDCLKITLAQLDNVLAPVGEEPDAAAFHRILQGMLEGMANTPDLPDPLRDTLMGCVDNWCADVKKVKDEGYTALLDGLKQAVEAMPEDERKPYEHIGYTAYARRVASTLDQIEDNKLPEVVRILRRCAKHCLGKDLHDTFTETINRIDVRNPSIGKIPEFAHAVWLGKQISQNDVKNILDFLRENESHQVHIATEKPNLTMRALLDYCEMSHGSSGQLTWLAKGKELLQRVKVDSYRDWLPADNEMIGDVTGKEIRDIIATLASGPGKNYAAASDLVRLLGLRREKTVNKEEKIKGGLYWDVDLQWHLPLQALSSPLGIMPNLSPENSVNNNLMGFPADTEVLDQLIVYIVHRYQQRKLGSALESVARRWSGLYGKISSAELSVTPTASKDHTGHDAYSDFEEPKESMTAPQKAEFVANKARITAEKRTRAREILESVDPANPMHNLLRHPLIEHENRNTGKRVSSRYALTLAVTGPTALASFMTETFGKGYPMHDRFLKLGARGGTTENPPRPGQIFSEASKAPWSAPQPAEKRRATISGSPIDGDLA